MPLYDRSWFFSFKFQQGANPVISGIRQHVLLIKSFLFFQRIIFIMRVAVIGAGPSGLAGMFNMYRS